MAILALALGIGPKSAIFTVVNAVLLKPWPMPEPDHVMMIWQTLLRSGFDQPPATGAGYLDRKQQSHPFENMSAAFAVGIGACSTPTWVTPYRIPFTGDSGIGP